MPWTADGGWRDPWLPLGDTARNVAQQRDDASSILAFVRRVIALRRSRADLRSGAYESLESPAGVWSFRRGESTLVTVNLSDRAVQLNGRALDPWTGTVSDSDGAPLL
jgi:alpha-glucosidase